MVLPVSFDADLSGGPQNSYHGPFRSSGGSFYTILRNNEAGGGDDNISAHKATDPASSFSEQDVSNGPAAGADIASIWVHQSSDLLNVVYQEVAGSNDVYFSQFNMAADAWVDLGTSDFDIQIESIPSGPIANACSIGTRSDSDIVVVYQGDSEMLMGTEYERIDHNISTDDGATWAGPVSIDNGATGGNKHWTGCVIVPGSSDRMHVFFKDDTNNDAYQRRINSDDSLETFPSSFDSDIDSGNYVFFHGVSYDDGGTQRVRCPYDDGASKVSIAKCDSEDTPTVTSDVDVSDNNAFTPALAVDGKNLQLLYSHNPDFDIYRDTNDDDAGWGTDTEERDGITATEFSPNVYDRSGTNRLAFVYLDSAVIKYDEIDLAAAVIPTVALVMAPYTPAGR